MKDFLKNNKSRIIRLAVLVFVFLFVVSYINGRSIYKNRTQYVGEGGRNTFYR